MPRHGIADFYGARRADHVRTAMTLDDHAVKAKKHSAIDIARIHFGLQRREGMTRQKKAKLRHEIMAPRFAEILRHLAGGAFRRLEGDVTGESFGDHDIDRPLANVVAFDKATVVEIRQAALAQQARSRLDLIDALDFLDTSIEQSHGRPFDGEDD